MVTKRRLHDRKTEHFKALAKTDNTSAIADHVKATGHNIKWDHFDILVEGKTDYHCKGKSLGSQLLHVPVIGSNGGVFFCLFLPFQKTNQIKQQTKHKQEKTFPGEIAAHADLNYM